MALVQRGSSPPLVASQNFVQVESYNNEVRESFLDRTDCLHLRVTYKDSNNVSDHYTRGRPDFLKGFTYTEDGYSEKRELEFYPREDQVIRYTHEVVNSKGGKTWRMRCTYDPEQTQHAVILRRIQLRRGESYTPDVDPPSALKSKIHFISEEFQASSDQPYCKWERDLESDTVKVFLWPTGTFATKYTGDMEIDNANLAVHVWNDKGQRTSFVNEAVAPSREELGEEFEWVLRRQEALFREIANLERFRFIFNHAFSVDVTDPTKNAVQQWANVENLIANLFHLVDACDVRSESDHQKGTSYDGMEALMQSKVARLEQQAREKDNLIRDLMQQLAERNANAA